MKSKKLGYTFYPKDWNSDDQVFELNLEQRGVFRELIDSAYMNDNMIPFNIGSWARRWNVEVEHLETLLDRLIELKLITINDQLIHVPSCENRLNIVRRNQQNGQGGGRPPKPKSEPKANPIEKPKEKKGKEKKRNKTPEIQKIVAFYNSHSPKQTTPETKSVIDSCEKALEKYSVDQLIAAINGRLFFLQKPDMIKHFTIQSIFRPSNIDGAVAAGEMDQPLIRSKPKSDGVKIAHDREMLKKPQFRNQSILDAYKKQKINE